MKLKHKLLTTLLLGAGLLQGAVAGEFTNFIGMKFVDIPAGSFQMGSCQQTQQEAFLGEARCSNPDKEAGSEETPRHRVDISAFQLGKYEVTLGQFKAFIKATGNTQLVDSDFMKYNAYGDSAAVVYVNWHDAKAFVAWLNQSKPASDSGEYRLPSESEWEYACKAGGNSRYCGGNDPGSVAWYNKNSGDHVHPVGTKQANAFGLHDMSGNAWEWLEDCGHDNYHGAPSNNNAWTSGNCSGRVLRGGSWYLSPSGLRAAVRLNGGSPGVRFNVFGFRLARTRP